jgi:hypothetical protein
MDSDAVGGTDSDADGWTLTDDELVTLCVALGDTDSVRLSVIDEEGDARTVSDADGWTLAEDDPVLLSDGESVIDAEVVSTIELVADGWMLPDDDTDADSMALSDADARSLGDSDVGTLSDAEGSRLALVDPGRLRDADVVAITEEDADFGIVGLTPYAMTLFPVATKAPVPAPFTITCIGFVKPVSMVDTRPVLVSTRRTVPAE